MLEQFSRGNHFNLKLLFFMKLCQKVRWNMTINGVDDDLIIRGYSINMFPFYTFQSIRPVFAEMCIDHSFCENDYSGVKRKVLFINLKKTLSRWCHIV